MKSFEHYLNKQKEFVPHINKNDIHPQLDKIIVIPCYNESNIPEVIPSLFNTTPPNGFTEIILVINSSETELPKIINNNKKTYQETTHWIKHNFCNHIKFHAINLEGIQKKNAGVGFARKTGMDEAIYRFNKIGKENGIIISLDADCTVEPNYLLEIEKHYKQFPETTGTSIYFEHNVTNPEFSNEVHNAINQYELHLRYYLQALRFTTYPYAFHTVGSCFTVSAKTYCKQGGMNKRQGGEEFYFLQKIIPLSNFYEINTTKVSPSPRPSTRVPFGTGPYVNKIINSDTVFETYNFKAFEELRELFTKINALFDSPLDSYTFYNSLSANLKSFISGDEFTEKINEICSNTANLASFRQRFYNWFNAFKILKYLNHTHENIFSKQTIYEASEELLKQKQIPVENNNLLNIYRNIELNKGLS